MFPKYFHFVLLVVVSLQLKGTACFFVKWFSGHYYGSSTSRYCISDTGQIQSNGSWGNLSFLVYSDNSCLDPAAQFRFRDNGAMLNLKRQGCVAAFNKPDSDLDMFYLYVDSVSLNTAACAQKPNESIYRAITHNPEGGLSVYYKGKDKSLFQTWCAWYTYNSQIYKKYGINRYMGLSTRCHSIYSTQKFIFGSVTCHGDKVKNANCPKDQYMVVKFATYRGLLAPKTCGLSDDYSCEVDVVCLVKKQCDGLHECNITVDDNLFSGNLCPGLSNYLYFEYQCVDTVKPFKELCVHVVSLSYSSLPYEGAVQITTDSGTKNVCWQSLKNRARETVCHDLGHDGVYSLVKMSTPTDAKDATFSGSINCNGQEKYLSQCSINASASESCSELSYIRCGYWLNYTSYFKPLLLDKRRFPDSSFSASVSSKGHSASDARISSGSSWCAPVSDDKHYLQVDLEGLYEISYLATYGDSTNPKWVATYNLNYTTDLAMVNWKTETWIFQGNKNAYDYAAWEYTYFKTRALRFIPLTYVGQPCMRVEIWGQRAAEKVIAETSSALTFSLKIPLKMFVYFYVVALKLKDGKEPASPNSYENNELLTYAEAEKSTNPKPYIAAVVTSSGVEGNMFILGDGRNTSHSTSRKRRSTTSDYFNGPLEPGTSYSIFQRIIINELGEYYSTAWSPPSKTSEDSDQVPGDDVSDTDDNDGSEKDLIAIIIASAILLVILCIIAYRIYQTRRLKSNTDVHFFPNSQHVYDDVGNYEQVRNELSTYIALKSPGKVTRII